ncbi:xrn 5 -3 exonuclease n-terminus domain-containing protein [Cyclospora cayetanensis]|nr:xrn 5 -3 exonuclease n-terminus domain-containing protein [Cyclospora cayetanensis]
MLHAADDEVSWRGPLPLRDLAPSRLVDDFVLLSFFVGNDFLPALPHINIFAGGLSTLLQTYARALPRLGGPLTRKTQIHLPRLIRFFALLADQEGPHFEPQGPPGPLGRPLAAEYYASKFPLRELAAAESDPAGQGGGPSGGAPRGPQERLPAVPFGAFRHALCARYVSGLFFLLHYYHSGAPSWAWTFPYNYAPLASDLGALRAPALRVTLPHAQPISPYLQLLAVLPHSSCALLPAAYRRVHTAPTHTRVEDLFPCSFAVDPYPLHAVPLPGKASELTEERHSTAAEGELAAAGVRAAMEEGRSALERALKRKPTEDKAAQLPEWLHRPLIPFLDLPRLRKAAKEALEEGWPSQKGPWRPEDFFRNRLGRPHVFLSPQLQRKTRSSGSGVASSLARKSLERASSSKTQREAGP